MITKKKNNSNNYVYLLGDFEKEGVYKIGVTRGTIENRIKKLQTGNSGELYIVDYYQTEHPFFVERWMHTKYFVQNVKNEWFSMTPEDVHNFKEDCAYYNSLYQYTKIEENKR